MFIFIIALLYAIIPISIVLFLNKPTTFGKERLALVKENLSANEEIFDKNKHRYWEKSEIKSEKGKLIKNAIFRIELNSGKIVYCLSDKQSNIYLPKDEEIAAIGIVDVDSVSEIKFHIYGAYYTIFLVIASFFMPSAINYYKKVNDPYLLSQQKAAKSYNNGINIINKKLDSVINQQEYLYVYTNDSLVDEAILTINYDIQQEYEGIDVNRSGRIASDFESFITNEKKYGYNVYLKSSEKWKNVQNLNAVDSLPEFKVINDYDLTEKEMKRLEENNKKRKQNYSYIKTEVTKHKNYIAVFNEQELQNHKLSSGLRRMMQPNIDLSRKDMLFYFTSYNRPITEEQLKEHLPDFDKMYLKKQKCQNCYIKKIKIVKHFSK